MGIFNDQKITSMSYDSEGRPANHGSKEVFQVSGEVILATVSCYAELRRKRVAGGPCVHVHTLVGADVGCGAGVGCSP